VSTRAPATSVCDLLTVRQAARIAGVCERTVWSDISSDRLAAIRKDRRTYVPRCALRGYRGITDLGSAVDQHLLTVNDVAHFFGVSVRTVRRRIKNGEYPTVHLSGRRIRIDAKRAKFGRRTLASWLAEERATQRPGSQRRRATDEASLLLFRYRYHLPKARDLLSVRFVADCSQRPPWEVYDHIKLRVLPAYRLPVGWSSHRIGIHWLDALVYAASPSAAAAIGALVARRYVQDLDADGRELFWRELLRLLTVGSAKR
jgi:excisionase family DNA binding protein